jgi:hypothetical protein
MRRHERVKYDPNEKFEMVSLLSITLVSIFKISRTILNVNILVRESAGGVHMIHSLTLSLDLCR